MGGRQRERWYKGCLGSCGKTLGDALGMEKGHIGKLLWCCGQQNLEADYMAEGGLGDRDGGGKTALLESGW